MSTRHFAAIDLGTNTFHLLIAAVDGDHWTPVYQEEIFVKLGRAGTLMIAPEAIEAGLDTLRYFKQKLLEFEVCATIAAGTAALRTASNGYLFVQQAAHILGVTPAIIDGATEAALIFKGVQSSIPATLPSYWIMDIGGGSVELIQVTNAGMTWKQSFPIGNALLTRSFHHSDPISISEQQALTQYLEATLSPLWERWPPHPPILVGAAGTFEVIAQACSPHHASDTLCPIDFRRWHSFFHQVIDSTREERIAWTGIPDDRVDYIVSALLLVQHILEKGKVHVCYASRCSLKEGLMDTLVAQHHEAS